VRPPCPPTRREEDPPRGGREPVEVVLLVVEEAHRESAEGLRQGRHRVGGRARLALRTQYPDRRHGCLPVGVCVVEYTPTMLVMALDVGTSSAPAACFDAAARPLPGAEGRVAFAPRTAADGTVEFDPDALVDAVAAAVNGCLAGAGARAAEIASVGASVFWHSLLALDGAGRPLTPLLTWADTRSAAAAAALRARLDARATHARTGAPLHAAFYPARLA